MTAAMIQTSLPTCADSETAPPAGNAAQVSPTTAASQNGSSAMEKTIAAITATSCQRTVPSANPRPTSSVRTTAAYRNNGRATLPTIAVTVQTKLKRNAKANTASAPSQSSVATMANASRADGDAVSLADEIFEAFL